MSQNRCMGTESSDTFAHHTLEIECWERLFFFDEPAGFSIELPRSFLVPDGVLAYIDDIVLPVGL